MSTPFPQQAHHQRRGLRSRALITLVLVIVMIVIIAFFLSQPVSAPELGSESTGELTGEATEQSRVGIQQTAKRQAEPAAMTGTIIFMSNRDGDYDVYTLDLASMEIVNLTNNGDEDGFASYSLDRAQISFLTDRVRREGEKLNGYLMNADGTNPVLATADIGTFFNILTSGRGDWDVRANPGSPDLVLVSLRDLNLEVYSRLSEEGGSGTYDTNLSRHGGIDWYAAASPDGGDVVFSSDRMDGQFDIYLTPINGGDLRRLTDDPADEWSPVFSTDGRWILFATERAGVMDNGQVGLYAIDLEAAPSTDEIPPALPVTQADYSEIPFGAVGQNDVQVYMALHDGNWEIFAQAGDDEPINLTNGEGDDLFPLWLPQ